MRGRRGSSSEAERAKTGLLDRTQPHGVQRGLGHDNITCFLHPITPHGIHDFETASLSVGKGPSADRHLRLGPKCPRSFSHGHSGQHLSSTYFLCIWSLPTPNPPGLISFLCSPSDPLSTFVFNSVNASRNQCGCFLLLL